MAALARYHLAVFPGPLSQVEPPETGLFDSACSVWSTRPGPTECPVFSFWLWA